MALKLGNFQYPKKASNPSIQIPDEAPAGFPSMMPSVKYVFQFVKWTWRKPKKSGKI